MAVIWSRWQDFEATHGALKDMTPARLQNLHTALQPFMIRRVKKDVEKSLPPKLEQLLRIEMTRAQKQLYKWILTRNFRELIKGGSTSSLLNIVMELKKCCNHSMLVQHEEHSGQDKLLSLIRGSGKLILLDKLLTRLREGGHRVLIFSQMVMMLDIIAEYLQLKRFAFQRLDGGIRGEERRRAMDHFNAPDSEDFCFLLSTRAGGLGINLATADTVIIFDSDWNPQNDLQAQARAHRIGQKKTVNIYRFVTKGSVEEDIIERAKQKMVLDHLVIQRMDASGTLSKGNSRTAVNASGLDKDELDAVMKFGAEELFKDAGDEETADKKLEEMSIDDILQKAETRDSTAQAVGAGDELLAQFKTVNIATAEEDDEEPARAEASMVARRQSMPAAQVNGEPTKMGKAWADIIPQSALRQIEEEEAQAKALALFLPKRRRAAAVNALQEPAATPASAKANQKANGKAKSNNGEAAAQAAFLSEFAPGQLRRFIRSYRKFFDAARLAEIASDAQMKSVPVKKLQQLMQEVERLAASASQEELEATQSSASQSQGPLKPGYFAFGPDHYKGVEFVQRKREILALGEAVKAVPSSAFRITEKVKDPKWDVTWTVLHDSMLLEGVYRYGIGNWEQLKADPDLDLGNILSADKKLKPQADHLNTRLEYLLRMCFPPDSRAVKPTQQEQPPQKPAATDPQTDDTLEVKRKPPAKRTALKQSKITTGAAASAHSSPVLTSSRSGQKQEGRRGAGPDG